MTASGPIEAPKLDAIPGIVNMSRALRDLRRAMIPGEGDVR
jgi:hypothetical protein